MEFTIIGVTAMLYFCVTANILPYLYPQIVLIRLVNLIFATIRTTHKIYFIYELFIIIAIITTLILFCRVIGPQRGNDYLLHDKIYLSYSRTIEDFSVALTRPDTKGQGMTIVCLRENDATNYCRQPKQKQGDEILGSDKNGLLLVITTELDESRDLTVTGQVWRRKRSCKIRVHIH